MIELRWQKRFFPMGELSDHSTIGEMRPVLQFRQRPDPGALSNTSSAWTDWTDVPEVDDD